MSPDISAIIAVGFVVPDFAETVLPDIAGDKIHTVIGTHGSVGENIGGHPEAHTAIAVGTGFEFELRVPLSDFGVGEIGEDTDSGF